MALHYVADFEGLLGKIHGLLVPGGTLVFSVEHPVFTAQGPQDWCYGEKERFCTTRWIVIFTRGGVKPFF